MKRHLSVFMLFVRSSFYKVFALFALMCTAEAASFFFTLKRFAGNVGLETIIRQSGMPWIFGACFLLMSAILCLVGCESGSKLGYTLRRLTVSEKGIFMWQSLYNCICYLVFWGFQVVLAFVLCSFYTAADLTHQTVFLAFYRSSFLHSILPFEELSYWIRNLFIVIGMGVCSAYFPFAQRNGKNFAAVIILAAMSIVFFVRGISHTGSAVFLVLTILVCMWAVLSSVFRKEKLDA